MAVITVKKEKAKEEIICPTCENLLLYEKEDVKIGYLGCESITCPECGTEMLTTGERIMPPTFPRTFFHFGDGAKASDKDIQEMVNRVVDNIKKADVGDFYNISVGDTMVVALKYEDNIDVIVTKDYWEDTLTNED